MPRTAPDWRLTAVLSTLRATEGLTARASCGRFSRDSEVPNSAAHLEHAARARACAACLVLRTGSAPRRRKDSRGRRLAHDSAGRGLVRVLDVGRWGPGKGLHEGRQKNVEKALDIEGRRR